VTSPFNPFSSWDSSAAGSPAQARRVVASSPKVSLSLDRATGPWKSLQPVEPVTRSPLRVIHAFSNPAWCVAASPVITEDSVHLVPSTARSGSATLRSVREIVVLPVVRSSLLPSSFQVGVTLMMPASHWSWPCCGPGQPIAVEASSPCSVSLPSSVDTFDCIELQPASATSRPSSVNCSRTRVFGASCFGFPFSVTDVDRYVLPTGVELASVPGLCPQPASRSTVPAATIIGFFTPTGRRRARSRCVKSGPRVGRADHGSITSPPYARANSTTRPDLPAPLGIQSNS
jgi:hypothetical protein